MNDTDCPELGDDDLVSPEASRAVAFGHARDPLLALRRAERYADGGGRVASLPDLAEARLAADVEDVVWANDFVTASAEYYGRSPGGVRLIAVLHGRMPHFGSGCAEWRDGIPQEDFLRVIGGAFGAVELVELKRLFELRPHPFTETLTYGQACDDPLTRARLGRAADGYLRLQRRIATDFVDGREDWAERNDCVIRVAGPDKRPYAGREPEKGVAAAHLLTLSSATDYLHGHYGGRTAVRHLSRITALGTYAAGPAKFVATRGVGPVAAVLPGMDGVLRDLPKLWPRISRPAPADAGPPPLAALTKVGMHWFTQRAREGVGEDDGEPEYRISGIAPAGRTEFTAPIRAGLGRLLYDPREIALVAPDDANAYRLVGEPRTVWNRKGASHVSVEVRFYRIRADCRSRLPPMEEVADDVALVDALTPER